MIHCIIRDMLAACLGPIVSPAVDHGGYPDYILTAYRVNSPMCPSCVEMVVPADLRLVPLNLEEKGHRFPTKP